MMYWVSKVGSRYVYLLVDSVEQQILTVLILIIFDHERCLLACRIYVQEVFAY